MTCSDPGQRFVDAYRATPAIWRATACTIRPSEHDACGVGFVAAIDGKPRREVVEAGDRRAAARSGIAARSTPTARPATAPASISRSRRTSSREQIRERQGRRAAAIAVGMVFLPRTDFAGQERCRTIVETEVLRLRLLASRLAPGAGRHLGDRRQGDRDPARDRADHARRPRGRRRRGVRARAVPDPPPDREPGAAPSTSTASTSARCPAGR